MVLDVLMHVPHPRIEVAYLFNQHLLKTYILGIVLDAQDTEI